MGGKLRKRLEFFLYDRRFMCCRLERLCCSMKEVCRILNDRDDGRPPRPPRKVRAAK